MPVCCVVAMLAVYLFQSRKKKAPAGVPLKPGTVVGMAQGKPEAWADFRSALEQPGPPDPNQKIREIVEEVLDARKSK